MVAFFWLASPDNRFLSPLNLSLIVQQVMIVGTLGIGLIIAASPQAAPAILRKLRDAVVIGGVVKGKRGVAYV